MYSDWLALTGRCVVIGFLSPLLSLSCLVSSRGKKISGTRLKNCPEEHMFIFRDQEQMFVNCLHLTEGQKNVKYLLVWTDSKT